MARNLDNLRTVHAQELGAYNDDLNAAKDALTSHQQESQRTLDALKADQKILKQQTSEKHQRELEEQLAEHEFKLRNLSGKEQGDLLTKHAEENIIYKPNIRKKCSI